MSFCKSKGTIVKIISALIRFRNDSSLPLKISLSVVLKFFQYFYLFKKILYENQALNIAQTDADPLESGDGHGSGEQLQASNYFSACRV